MRPILLLSALIASAPLIALADDTPRVHVPDGFGVALYADDDLAHDIYSMTIDSLGRVVVSGPGYVRILLDTDGDGRADAVRQYADGPRSGAQGLFFHGRDLLAVGDAGLLRYRDKNGDDRADGPPEVFLKIKTGGEHNAHAIRQGPDGWWYLLAGNSAGVNAEYASLPTSPIRRPQAGTLLRLKPDISGGEIVADGFRNAYDFAFGADGDVFVYDSDGERDVSLPWYRPTRVFNAVPRSSAGWQSRSWKRPAWYPDTAMAVAAFGRGSPTGVACYRHDRFPPDLQGAVFVLDWTFGRVLTVHRSDALDESVPVETEFMSGKGHFGFAPTDVAVAPDGSLYVSVGGRGSRGGVFRVWSTSPSRPRRKPSDPLGQCLAAPQPLSSWSRARWRPIARRLGRDPFVAAAADPKRSTAGRVRAIEILVELYRGLDGPLLASLATDEDAAVRGRAAWAIGRTAGGRPDAKQLAPFLADRHWKVARPALEALIGASAETDWARLADGLLIQLDSSHPGIRHAASRVMAFVPRDRYRQLLDRAVRRSPRAAVAATLGRTLRTGKRLDRPALDLARHVLSINVSVDLKRDTARLAQLALGDVGPGRGTAAVFDGYNAGISSEQLKPLVSGIATTIVELFPTGDPRLDFELARLAAMARPAEPKLLSRFLATITPRSSPIDDIHYLVAAARLPVARSVAHRRAIARGLVELQPKIDRRELNQDSNWDDRVGEMFAELVRLDPALPTALLDEPSFGEPGHVVFLPKVPDRQLPRVIEAFLEKIRAAGEDYRWTGEVIYLLGRSAVPEHRQLIRDQFDRYGVQGAVLMVLAGRPDPVDRSRFVTGLESPYLEVLTACINALKALPASRDAAGQIALVATLRRLGADRREYILRELVVRLLRKNSGREFGFAFGSNGHRTQRDVLDRWTDWLAKSYPAEVSRREGRGRDERRKLRGLLARVDWSAGNAAAGRVLFEKRACAQCHGGRRALGPDLAGAAGRFSRDDLFTAIALPNRDVSPRYQTTLVQTVAGRVYTGLVIYDSVDGVTIRTATNQTIRIENDQVELRRRLPNSLMPGGLLADLGPGDLANLYAYLKTLRR